MKIIILLAVLTIALADVEYYETPNDNYDVESFLNNLPLFQATLDCYKDVGPCSETDLTYKKNIPDAIRTACRKCNPAQKKLFGRSLEILKQLMPQEYILFKQKHDPENKYFDALEEEVFKYTKKQ